MKKTHLLLLALISAVALRAQSLQWGLSWGSTASDQFVYVHLSPQGDLYTCARLPYTGTTDVDPGPAEQWITTAGHLDILVSKFQPDGQLIWAKSVGGTGFDEADLRIDNEGNIYLTGFFSNEVDFDLGPGTFILTSSGGKDVFVAKYNADMELIWARSIGGAQDDEVRARELDAQGRLVVAGNFAGTVDFDPGPGQLTLVADSGSNVFAFCLDNNGSLVWANNLGAAVADNNNQSLAALATDHSGNTTALLNFTGQRDADPGPGVLMFEADTGLALIILRLQSNGQLLSAKMLGGTGGDIVPFTAEYDPQNNLVICGLTFRQEDFDPGVKVRTLPDNTKAFLVKYTADSDLGWVKAFEGDDLGFIKKMLHRVAPNGDIYFTGSSIYGTIDFDPGIGQFLLTSQANYNGFLAKYTPNGLLKWAYAQSNVDNSFTEGESLAINEQGDIYLGGFFLGAFDCDPGFEAQILTTNGFGDHYVLKLLDNTVDVQEPGTLPSWQLMPNPSNGLISWDSQLSWHYSLRNALGVCLLEGVSVAGKNEIDIRQAPAGVYFLQCEGGKTLKLIKQ
ncbi:MAG: T9SS type A sorting domain-containing protein [Chitinophagales bacterium]|nr:T9SS type A sorting domain-containing protein [Chitinophagales bacterium]